MERMKRILACCFCLLLAMTLFLSCSAYSSNGQKIPAKGVYHKIKKGETFYSIARAYQVKLQDLAEVNNISNHSERITRVSPMFKVAGIGDNTNIYSFSKRLIYKFFSVHALHNLV